VTITPTEWVSEHFIGGHPALDLANAVYDRRAPVANNELFGSIVDIAGWLRASGIADETQADLVSGIADAALLDRVRGIREATFAIFDAIANGKPVPAEALGLLFQQANDGLSAARMRMNGTRAALTPSQWRIPDAITMLLAILSIEAFFNLPRERIRSCPRCGWVFVDTSRGGKRRWCSMDICGNREKSARHKAGVHR
jgi:predicted RNA-binding Zn ribbon-like protein